MKLILYVALTISVAPAQIYDLVLKGGHVIDPANGIDGVRDIAVLNGKIAHVAGDISSEAGRKTVNVAGLFVTPGLVDIHTHVYGAEASLFPDDTSLVTGATTVVDAGGSGWRNFDDFRSKIIRPSKTRVFVLLNIVGAGMIDVKGESNVADMDH